MAGLIALVLVVPLALSVVNLGNRMGYLSVRVLSGPEQGNYYAVVGRLEAAAKRRHGTLVNRASSGTVDNLAKLAAAADDCAVEFAMVQDGVPAPAGAELELTMQSSAPPGLVPADAPAVLRGLDAFEETLGVRPLLVRSGGSIPLVSALAGRGVATVLTGFALNESNVHSPNERIPAAYLPLGIETAAALYRHLGNLG
jgi:acetylornithine deacetylase/succinyl-diaminopimelate desuccinylase-like protein